MWSLTLSFFVTNLIHVYVLIRHRDSKQPTISERAVQSQSSLALYVAGHILAGLAFAGFAYQFFWLQHSSPILFLLALGGVLLEWIQALIPAKGKYEPIHRAIANGMSGFIVALGVGAIVSIPLPLLAKTLLIALELVILAGYPLTTRLPHERFWVIQMVNMNLFYLQMYILLLAA